MKLDEFKQLIDRNLELNPSQKNANVCIEVQGSGIGGTNVVNVKMAQLGFDWDHGKFIIYPKDRLEMKGEK